MNRIISLGCMLVATAVIAIAVAYAQPGGGGGPEQESRQPQPVPGVGGPGPGAYPAAATSTQNGFVYGGLYGATVRDRADESAAALQQAQEKVSSALQMHADAESDEQRAAAQTELRQAVAEQFELLMKPREAQIEELRARLDKLTQHLQKRREAKDEIVNLRVKVLISEADGLGFYPEGAAGWLDGGESGYDMGGYRGYGSAYGAGYPGAGYSGGGYPGGGSKVPKGVPTQPRVPNVAR